MPNQRKEKRTYKDRAEYMKRAVVKRRKKVLSMALEYKGGQCVICSYAKCPRALCFHHVDPSTKKFGISENGMTRAWEKTKTELDKCVLLCSNCHMEVHAGVTLLPKEVL